ncbi:ROK family transcriptional regulator [Litorisediminicola beolgyonensis]|uniref:ROK family transcriptional regulator n=1 Tax=Litorisediminicola beolgyonensis TaxID=1173614 RepID=A0ABW3ZCN0_9RHOB
MRAHNERLVLSLVRRNGALPKAEIARLTGLSAQTVSVIMRQLEAEGLLLKGEPMRGKVGQPSVPMALNPEGAFFYGLKVGRRSTELVLTNFVGEVVGRRHTTHRFPMPEATVEFATTRIAELTDELGREHAARVAGVGIAMPYQIWDWAETIGLEPSAMAAWKHRDIRRDLDDKLDWPVFLQNDASSACGAELVFGDQSAAQDFLYAYVGYFIGGGVVLNRSLFTGPSGNAGAIGSMPVPDGKGGWTQLIERASLVGLESLVEAQGGDASGLWTDAEAWSVDEAQVAAWVATAAQALAHAITSAISVIDFSHVLIDGWMPASVRAKLVDATRDALAHSDFAGLTQVEIREGSVGPDARVMGAASLPLSERFLVDGKALFSAG